MRYILDASFFFGDYPSPREAFTTPEVITELLDITAKMRYEVLVSQGLIVTEPGKDAIAKTVTAAEKSGDLRVLSPTDISVIALALELTGTIISDDFAIQNVSRHLKIPIQNILQKKAKRRVWKYICSGCGVEIPNGGECPICGSLPKKRGTERSSQKQR